MFTLLLIIHVLVCLLLIAVVLMQSGKGGLGSAFGGESFFGGKGATPFLATATTVLAIVFMATSLSLAMISGRRDRATSAIERSLQQEQRRPAAPGKESPSDQTGDKEPGFPSGK